LFLIGIHGFKDWSSFLCGRDLSVLSQGVGCHSVGFRSRYFDPPFFAIGLVLNCHDNRNYQELLVFGFLESFEDGSVFHDNTRKDAISGIGMICIGWSATDLDVGKIQSGCCW
jgi:hypothetical protein